MSSFESRSTGAPVAVERSASQDAGRAVVVSRPARAALLSAAALGIAVLAQTYLLRRVFLGDAFFLYVAAIILFLVTFHSRSSLTERGALRAAVRVGLVALAMLALGVALNNLMHGRNFVPALALLFAPLPLLGLTFGGQRATSRPDEEPEPGVASLGRSLPATPAQARIDWLILAAGLLLALVSIAYWFKQGRGTEALALNGASLALVMLAVWRMDRGRAHVAASAPRAAEPAPVVQLAILGVITAVAVFLRTWQLTEIPYGIWFDEGQTGLEALRILKGMPFTPMGTFSSANPSLFFYVVAFAFKLMGPTLLAVRLVQAATGVLTIVIFYPFLRSIMGWRAAVIGSFLLAVSSWHVNWSRFGMPYSIGAPLFEVASAYLLLRALRSGRHITFAVAGAVIGLGLYTYFGFRLFPFAVLAYLIYGLVLNKERVRQSICGLVVYAVVALIVALPLGAWAWQNRVEFMSRTTQTSVFAGKTTNEQRMAALENSLRRHALMLNYIGDGNGRHGVPGAPAVDVVTGALFIIGLGYALYRWRSPAHALLVIWFVVGMMAGVMSLDWEAPQQHRTLVAIPAIYGLAAIVGGKIWENWARWATSAASIRSRYAALGAIAACVALILAGVGYVNYDRYFNQQMKRSDVYYSFSAIETTIARRVAELGVAGNRFYIQVVGSPAFSFLVGGDTPDRPIDSVFFRSYAHMPLREEITKTAVFLLEPWRVTIEPADVLRYYPNAQFIDHRDPFGQTMVHEFRVPASDVNNLLGLRGRYYAGDTAAGEPLLERTDKTLDVDWSAAAPVSAPFNVEWTGSIIPPNAGTYTLEIETDGEVRVSLDGAWLALGPGTSTQRIDLAKGMHPVVITFRGQRLRLFWTVPGGQREIIPATALVAAGLPDNGLVGSYYRSENWQGRAEFVQVDPYLAFRWHPDPIEPTPWSAIWKGKIEVPVAGKYIFQGVSNDRMWLLIDGKTYLDSSRSMAEVTVDLAAGRHDIEVRYANTKGYSEMRLMWRMPGGAFEVVPNRYLFVK